MNLPASIRMRETIHGHGAKGMAFYGYEDTGGLGVQMEARRENGRSPFVETWFHKALPERKFSAFDAMRTALEALTDEEIEAEASKYPRFRNIEPDSCGNACRLCPLPPFTGERIKHDTYRVHLALGWRAVTDWPASLCEDHLIEFDRKPVELLAALEAARTGAHKSNLGKRNPS